MKNWFKMNDIVFLLAAGSLGWGVYQVNQPAAFITIGILFLVITTYGKFRG